MTFMLLSLILIISNFIIESTLLLLATVLINAFTAIYCYHIDEPLIVTILWIITTIINSFSFILLLKGQSNKLRSFIKFKLLLNN